MTRTFFYAALLLAYSVASWDACSCAWWTGAAIKPERCQP